MSLIPNKGWESGDAGGWVFAGSAPPVVSSEEPRTGIYSLKHGTNSASIRTATSTFTITDSSIVNFFKGQPLTFSVWTWIVLDFAGGGGSFQRIEIYDGVGQTRQTISPTPYSTWNKTEVTRTISGGATEIRFQNYWYKAGGGRIYRMYLDDMDTVPDNVAGFAGLNPAMQELLMG